MGREFPRRAPAPRSSAAPLATTPECRARKRGPNFDLANRPARQPAGNRSGHRRSTSTAVGTGAVLPLIRAVFAPAIG